MKAKSGLFDKKMISELSEEARRKIAATLLAPKRCGGMGYGTCVECGEQKATYEKRRSDSWVCVECRVAKGAYERTCDDCHEKKPAQHAPAVRWHWWCDDCVTPWREQHMKSNERAC